MNTDLPGFLPEFFEQETKDTRDKSLSVFVRLFRLEKVIDLQQAVLDLYENPTPILLHVSPVSYHFAKLYMQALQEVKQELLDEATDFYWNVIKGASGNDE